MLDNYLIIHKSILPDYYEKVAEAKRLLESGKVKEVSLAVKEVGISRSTFYKYKDYIMEPAEMAGGRKAVLTMMLSHENGVLSTLLKHIAEAGCSVVTITQSLPIHDMASVTLAVDVSGMPGPMADLLDELSRVPGVENVRLLALE